MSFNIIFAAITMVIVLFGALLKGKSLERLFYIFILNMMIIILVNKGVPLALLFVGTIIPMFTRNKYTIFVTKNDKGSNQSIRDKFINYICFAPLIGLGIMSYKIPQAEIEALSPTMIILGEISLLVVTFLVIIPKRIKLR